MRTVVSRAVFGWLLVVLGMGLACAEDAMKPFVFAYKGTGDMAHVVDEVKNKLTGAGFQIAGSYSPYDGATVIVVTNDALKSAAAKTPMGGFGAAQRVSVTQLDGEIQVAYTNPVYMADAYRMNADLSGVAADLEKALGKAEEFGPPEGRTPKQLAKFHYMFGMPYFDDAIELNKFGSHDEAVHAIEQGLAGHKGGTAQVYRIDVPGTEQTVFGVALTDAGCGGDQFIMKEIDFKPQRSTAQLPYEILVAGNVAYALHPKFRIAINFPDLKMMGSHSFMGIMCAPGEIESELKKVAGKS